MAEATNILTVDDDPQVCGLMERVLTSSGFRALTANTSEEMRRLINKTDVVLLDINLSGESGIDLARELRITHPGLGIIMVTGLASEVDRIVGLEVGADDYICKPFNSRELIARVRCVLRRLQGQPVSSEGEIRFLDYVVDLESHQVKRRDELIKLTGHEFKLLVMLTEKPNKVYSREEISRHVCEREWYPYDRGVDVLVSKLRNKLETSGEQVIQSLRGVGYQFCARVERTR